MPSSNRAGRRAVPELPEVETIVRSLRPRLAGARIDDLWTSGLPLRLARPVDAERLRETCRTARIGSVERRGEYIVIGMQAAGGGVLVHLGVSGRLRVQAQSEAREKHTHVVWSLESGEELRFVDPRRFGLVRAWGAGETI